MGWDEGALLGRRWGWGCFSPSVLLRSLGAGDWKLAGLWVHVSAQQLITVLMGTIWWRELWRWWSWIWKRRLIQTLQ
jgi:hypothetical protein